MASSQHGLKERLMIDAVDPRMVWIVPFDTEKGAVFASGDCSFIVFDSEEEAFTYVRGYIRGLTAR